MARILVVDDVEQYRNHLSQYLLKRGHQVETAGDFESAVRLGQAFDPDVLIVDWRLGDDVEGIDVARSLRQGSPDLKTIVMSGYPEELVRQSLRASGSGWLLFGPRGTLSRERARRSPLREWSTAGACTYRRASAVGRPGCER